MARQFQIGSVYVNQVTDDEYQLGNVYLNETETSLQTLTVPDASATASAIAPTIVPGSVILAGTVAAAVASAIAPTVIPGAVTLSVPVVSADASAIAPGISSQAQGTAPANTLWFGDFV